MPIHNRLVFISVLHGLLGTGFNLNIFVNYYQPVLKPLVNQSFYNHYGLSLNENQFSWLWSSIADSNNFGKLIGALFIGYFLDEFGRRDSAMVIRNLIGILACAFEVLAKPLQSFELIIIGHFLAGVSFTFQAALLVYIAECVPTEYRGLIVLATGAFDRSWKALAAAIALPEVSNTEHLWIYYPIANAILPILHLACTWLLPRSPKYLYIHKLKREKSLKSIIFYHGDSVDAAKILEEYDREAELGQIHPGKVTYKTIWGSRHLRLPFLICVIAVLSTPFSALSVRGQYSNAMLISFGVPPEKTMYFFIILNSVCVPFTLVASILVEKIGRRPLFLSTILMALFGVFCLFGAQLAAINSPSAMTSTAVGFAGFLLGTLSSIFGLFKIPQLLIGEICPQTTRGKASSASSTAAIVATIILVFVFPPLQDAINAYSYLPMAVCEIICFFLLWKYMPETKNLSVDEIVSQFRSRQSSEEDTPLLS